jgi:hypothetical protein
MLNNMSLHYKRSLNLQLIIYVINSEYYVKGKLLASEMQIKRIQAFKIKT